MKTKKLSKEDCYCSMGCTSKECFCCEECSCDFCNQTIETEG